MKKVPGKKNFFKITSIPAAIGMKLFLKLLELFKIRKGKEKVPGKKARMPTFHGVEKSSNMDYN
jgi:hypothetical protein